MASWPKNCPCPISNVRVGSHALEMLLGARPLRPLTNRACPVERTRTKIFSGRGIRGHRVPAYSDLERSRSPLGLQERSAGPKSGCTKVNWMYRPASRSAPPEFSPGVQPDFEEAHLMANEVECELEEGASLRGGALMWTGVPKSENRRVAVIAARPFIRRATPDPSGPNAGGRTSSMRSE